jgi:hypothetical protein
MKKHVLFGEAIFNIASYNLTRNFRLGGKNTKRAQAQMNVIITYMESENKQTLYKELANRCEEDIVNILQIGGLESDLCRECWLAGFNYAFERIKKIFELKEKQ